MAVDETLLRDRLAGRPRPLSPGEIARDGHQGGPLRQSAAPDAPEPTPDDADALPLAGDAYRAHSRLGNKPEPMLSLMLADATLQAFAYGDLRHLHFLPEGGKDGNPVLVLKFPGVGEVRLEGRNLDTLFDHLRRQRISWVRERPKRRDFLADDDGAVVITGIGIRALE